MPVEIRSTIIAVTQISPPALALVFVCICMCYIVNELVKSWAKKCDTSDHFLKKKSLLVL